MMSIPCFSTTRLRVAPPQCVPEISQGGDVANVRHLANFHPCIWGDHFTQYSNNVGESFHVQQEIQVLKTDVKMKLRATSDKPVQHLKLIGDITGLGLGYHFEDEIEEAMESIFERDISNIGGYDLYNTSLLFRLLRQSGYKVPSHIFNKFVDEHGGIKEEFHEDVRGLLGLYEAAHLRLHDDVVLDQALNTCIDILESSSLTKNIMEVKNALKVPTHKDIRRLRTRKYIESYADQSESSSNLLKMAKLDFNLLQQRYQYEIGRLTTWWRELGLASKCPFARDRVVELYVWSMSILYEPQYNISRMLFTKVCCVLTVIDDTYDAYGKADELELLTESIARCDRSLIQQMPPFLKATFEALLDVFQEIEQCMAQQGKSYRTPYVIEAVQSVCKGYHDEYIWFKNGHVPTMEEFLPVALITVAVHTLAILSMIGMRDDNINEESFDWISKNPKILSASRIFCRLKADIVSHKVEQARGHHPSAVECYVKQYGVSEQEAYTEFRKQATAAWLDMNECVLKPTPVPFKVLDIIVNIARIVEVFYMDGDGISKADEFMKSGVEELLVNPIPI